MAPVRYTVRHGHCKIYCPSVLALREVVDSLKLHPDKATPVRAPAPPECLQPHPGAATPASALPEHAAVLLGLEASIPGVAKRCHQLAEQFLGCRYRGLGQMTSALRKRAGSRASNMARELNAAAGCFRHLTSMGAAAYVAEFEALLKGNAAVTSATKGSDPWHDGSSPDPWAINLKHGMHNNLDTNVHTVACKDVPQPDAEQSPDKLNCAPWVAAVSSPSLNPCFQELPEQISFTGDAAEQMHSAGAGTLRVDAPTFVPADMGMARLGAKDNSTNDAPDEKDQQHRQQQQLQQRQLLQQRVLGTRVAEDLESHPKRAELELPNRQVECAEKRVDDAIDAPVLHCDVMEYVQVAAPKHPIGVPFSRVCKRFSNTPVKHLQRLLGALVNDGDLYTTVDDLHYACS